MNKTLLALAAATSMAVSLLAAPPAEARCWGCAVGVGVAAGVVTGAIVGSAIASTYGPAYAVQPGYVAYPGYVGARRMPRRLLGTPASRLWKSHQVAKNQSGRSHAARPW
jgi:hypothetical protein